MLNMFWCIMNFSIAVHAIPPDSTPREPVAVVSASGQMVKSGTGQVITALGKGDS